MSELLALVRGGREGALIDWLLAHPEVMQRLCDRLDARRFN